MTSTEPTSQEWHQAYDFTAFQRSFQATAKHQGQPNLAPLLGQWEVLIAFFKHGIEIPRLIGKPATTPDQHRALLTTMLSMGEMIYAQTKSLGDDEVRTFGYERTFIEVNLQYLRGKYLDWYSIKDEGQIKADLERILADEGVATP